MALPDNPITRKEAYLAKIAGQEVQIPDTPITREEAYLDQIAKRGVGTKVIANPDDVAEDVLHKVEIDGEIYSVPSGGGGGGTSDYLELDNKPQINGVELSGNKTTGDLEISYNDLTNKPTIPDELADLTADSTHRTVTDTEKATWNGKSDFSGDYNDLDNKPIIPNAQVQSDWEQSNSSEVDYIKNKPALGTAAVKSVPVSGDAGSGEVVMGNDSRLSDSRPASDVSSWAKQPTKPTYTASEVGAIPSTDKGTNGGVAELDSNGKVPSSQVPLGETSSTAYRGDRGKTAYDHSQTTGNPHGTAFSDLTNKPENANTFQGTIAEWNQLTTAEKKAYDHASIPDSIDGGVTFPANKVVMAGGENVDDRLDANKFETAVDLASYTSSNPYTCPLDGYVVVKARELNGYVVVSIVSKSGNASIDVSTQATASNFAYNALFVKKGMKLYPQSTITTNLQAIFVPLVM